MNDPNHPSPPPSPPRRDFLKKALAAIVGGVVTLVPAAAGLLVWLDPLRRRAGASGPGFISVTSLDALPADDVPRKFQVITDRVDAWTTTRNVPVGAVFLKRSSADKQVVAWNVVCPHAGCFIDVTPDARAFRCPCHNSGFNADGSLAPGSVSPRPMDTLEVDAAALAQGQVRVKFQNFVAAMAEKRPVG